jgi:DNA-binding transcriptional regulator YiaG
MNMKKLTTLIAAIGSQRATARGLGVNERTVRRWVSGERSPSDKTVARLRELAKGIGAP